MSEHEHSHEHSDKKKENYTISKVMLWQGISAILAIVIVVMFFVGPKGSEGAANIPTPTQQPNPTPTQPTPSAERVEVDLDDDAVKGDPDAPITIVEFSDYQCPFCGRWFEQTLPQIEKEYIETGKVKLIFRDFPLSFHPEAQPAAEAAECAREQGGDEVYFKYHDALFKGQASLSSATYEKIASEVGVDVAKFKECVSARKFQDEVEADFAAASQYGVSGTPTFFINGVKLVGAMPYASFKQAIDAELAK